MLNDDLEQKMKEKLLEGLIEHMEGRMGERMSPPVKPEAPLGVTVEADDKSSLTDGLDKAKDVLASGKLHVGDADDSHSDPESDEDRLLQLLEEDEDEEDKR